MSKDTPSDKHSSHITFSSSAISKSANHKRKNEAQKLEQESLAFLDIDSDTLHSGSRQLRSQKTLFMSDEDKIRKEVERGRIIDEEITYRPLRPGQKDIDERFKPQREDFEYIYSHIDEVRCQVWASNLEAWLFFINHHNLYPDPSVPILDKDGIEYPDISFSLDNLLQLPSNKKYLKKTKSKTADVPTTVPSVHSTSGDKNLSDAPPLRPTSSSGSSDSFVLVHQGDSLEDNPTNGSNPSLITEPSQIPNPDSLGLPPSTGATPTGTPQGSQSQSPFEETQPIVESRTSTPDSDLDFNMTSLKERSVFFPSEKFDGRNTALTKQHWQTFEDFCDQQKLYLEDKDEHARAASIDQIKPFFKMTLTGLARAWLDRQEFDTPIQLKEKFLTDFSCYGKTHRQWIAKWSELKFNPDIDNIDEFIEKFEDLASLNNLQDDYKLHAFKIAMPREIELHLRTINNLQDCYQTAKELLTIVQNPVTNKMSTLSLAQSRSPSPQPKSRSPSPRNGRSTSPTPDRSRPRTRSNFEGFRQYPGPSRPQSILKRPFRNNQGRGRGRGRPMFNGQRPFNRPRSVSRGRQPPLRCFNCNMIGHLARNCFTRTRSQSQNRSGFPRRFTPNPRRNQRQMIQRYPQPRVRFQEQNNRYQQNRYQGGYQNQNRPQNQNRYADTQYNSEDYSQEYSQEQDEFQTPNIYDLNQ